jgi:hypothetical protein
VASGLPVASPCELRLVARPGQAPAGPGSTPKSEAMVGFRVGSPAGPGPREWRSCAGAPRGAVLALSLNTGACRSSLLPCFYGAFNTGTDAYAVRDEFTFNNSVC